MARHNENETPEFEERVVFINRVSKVVKGGRRSSFSALVVVGNKKGKISYVSKGVKNQGCQKQHVFSDRRGR